MKKILHDFWIKPNRVGNHWEYWFWEECWRENIRLIWPVKNDQTIAYVRETFGVEFEPDHCAEGRCLEVEPVGRVGSGAQVICLSDWKNDSKWNSVLAHECFHAACHILNTTGVKFIKGGPNEHHAYLMERLIRRCHAALDSVPVRPKTKP